MVSMQKTEEQQFGLDIGTSAIRLVEVVPGQERPTLVGHGSKPLPADLTSINSGADKKRLVDLIKQLIDQTDTKSNQAVVSLPAENFYVSVMQVPQMSDNDFNAHIFPKMSEQMSAPQDNLRIDWHIINRSVGDGEMLVFVVAAYAEVVETYVDIINSAGLSLRAVEINALALARSVIKDGRKPVIVLDFGQKTSEVASIWQRVPYRSRFINAGESVFASTIAQSLNVDMEEAYQFLKQYGASSTKFDGQILKAIRTPLDSIVRHITESTTAFADFSMEAKIEKVIITGTITAMPEAPSYIADNTNLPVEIANPWANIAYPATKHEELMSESMEYAVASGLALRDFV